VFGIGAAVDIVEQERRQDALCGGAIVAGGGNNHHVLPGIFIVVTGQAGNSRLAGLVFIKSFNGGVDKAEMRHHRLARASASPARMASMTAWCCSVRRQTPAAPDTCAGGSA
jgi:hypothetical protein